VGEMSDTERQMLAMQQGCEQLSELLRTTVAPLVRQYYTALTEGDALTDEAATMLTAEVQAEFLTMLFHGGNRG
jgi:hypothetical protein